MLPLEARASSGLLPSGRYVARDWLPRRPWPDERAGVRARGRRSRRMSRPRRAACARDGVRLLVARRSTGAISHHTLRRAARPARPGRRARHQRVGDDAGGGPGAAHRDGGRGAGPLRHPRPAPGRRLAGGRDAQRRRPRGRRGCRCGRAARARAAAATLELVAPYASGQRLMLARVCCALPVDEYLERHGEPIRYGHVRERVAARATTRTCTRPARAAPRCRAPGARSPAS